MAAASDRKKGGRPLHLKNSPGVNFSATALLASSVCWLLAGRMSAKFSLSEAKSWRLNAPSLPPSLPPWDDEGDSLADNMTKKVQRNGGRERRITSK